MTPHKIYKSVMETLRSICSSNLGIDVDNITDYINCGIDPQLKFKGKKGTINRSCYIASAYQASNDEYDKKHTGGSGHLGYGWEDYKDAYQQL